MEERVLLARAGTGVALGFPLAAAVALGGSYFSGVLVEDGNLWVFALLPLLCALYGLCSLTLDERSWVGFERPTLVLAGLVGGPLVGALCGVANGLGESDAVWRRRATYTGLGCLQGIAAGMVGSAWHGNALSLESAVALATLASVAVGFGGFSLVLWARKAWTARRFRNGLVVDVGEALIAAPVVYLLARSFDSAPAASVAATASVFVAVALVVFVIRRERSRFVDAQRAGLRDSLTGLLNRAGFDEALRIEHARVLRGGQPAGILVLDLDHFREFNTEHGHLGGDAALRHAAGCLTACVRSMDVVGRWGGEELCVLAPEIGSLHDLEQLAGRLRRSLPDNPLSLDGRRAGLTVSVGGSLLVDWVSAEAAFARADEALYLAKQRRNDVRVLEPLERTTAGSPRLGEALT